MGLLIRRITDFDVISDLIEGNCFFAVGLTSIAMGVVNTPPIPPAILNMETST